MDDSQKNRDNFHSYIANVLAINKIPLENVFFINTPNSVVLYSSYDKAIMQRPAADYSKFITRKVIFEKCKYPKKYTCFFHREDVDHVGQVIDRPLGEKIISRPIGTMTYALNWNESCYGEEFDIMESLRKFVQKKSHLPIFMYIDFESDFFETLKTTKRIRIATLDTTVI
jgi:hypothetical protein